MEYGKKMPHASFVSAQDTGFGASSGRESAFQDMPGPRGQDQSLFPSLTGQAETVPGVLPVPAASGRPDVPGVVMSAEKKAPDDTEPLHTELPAAVDNASQPVSPSEEKKTAEKAPAVAVPADQAGEDEPPEAILARYGGEDARQRFHSYQRSYTLHAMNQEVLDHPEGLGLDEILEASKRRDIGKQEMRRFPRQERKDIEAYWKGIQKARDAQREAEEARRAEMTQANQPAEKETTGQFLLSLPLTGEKNIDDEMQRFASLAQEKDGIARKREAIVAALEEQYQKNLSRRLDNTAEVLRPDEAIELIRKARAVEKMDLPVSDLRKLRARSDRSYVDTEFPGMTWRYFELEALSLLEEAMQKKPEGVVEPADMAPSFPASVEPQNIPAPQPVDKGLLLHTITDAAGGEPVEILTYEGNVAGIRLSTGEEYKVPFPEFWRQGLSRLSHDELVRLVQANMPPGSS